MEAAEITEGALSARSAAAARFSPHAAPIVPSPAYAENLNLNIRVMKPAQSKHALQSILERFQAKREPICRPETR